MKPSGIGGQAVIEGIMMRNKNVYSVAVRKPDNSIEVIKKESTLLTEKYKILNLPIIRGVINFVESLVVGTSTLTYSASFYEDPKEQEPTKLDHLAKAIFKEKLESIIMFMTVLVSIAFAIGLFMLAPYYFSRLVTKFVVSNGVLNLIEGIIRVFIFIIYILLISLMKDIKRVYMYHGAEHKCINCIEHGLELNVDNVRKSSKEHKRCGTSFIFFVMFISVIFFIFIRVDSRLMQILVRLILVPVIAGVSYEIIRLAGRSDNKIVNIISKPGMWLQALTTREPDDSMIEVAIKAVEEVFDWRTFLREYHQEEVLPDTKAEGTESSAGMAYESAAAKEKLPDLENIEEFGAEPGLEINKKAEDIEAENTEAENTDAKDKDTEDIEEDAEQAGDEGEKYEEGDKDDEDDGIQFIEEDDEDVSADELPLFRQRKTEL